MPGVKRNHKASKEKSFCKKHLLKIQILYHFYINFLQQNLLKPGLRLEVLTMQFNELIFFSSVTLSFTPIYWKLESVAKCKLFKKNAEYVDFWFLSGGVCLHEYRDSHFSMFFFLGRKLFNGFTSCLSGV